MIRFKIDGVVVSDSDVISVPDLNYERDSKNPFFRKKLGGVLMRGSTYDDLLAETDLCQKYDFDVEQYCSGAWSNIYAGFFTKLNCELNEDRCTVKITPKLDDDYKCVFDAWEEEFDIIGETTSYTIEVYSGTVQSQDCVSLNDPTDPPVHQTCAAALAADQWVLLQTIADATTPPAPPYDVTSTYIREFSATLPSGAGWVAVSGGYARKIPVRFKSEDILAADHWYYYNEKSLGTLTQIDNGYLLNEILEDKLFPSCGLSLVSNFFNINPDGTEPTNAAYTAADDAAHSVMVFQKTDIKDVAASNPATRGYISFKKMLEQLASIFNVAWVIDGTKFRLEHISYFEPSTVGIDLTTLNGGKWCANKNEYSYQDYEVPQMERFKMMEQDNEDFVGLPIEYSANCYTTDPKDIQADKVSTDISHIQEMPDEVSNEGFVFVATHEDSGTYYLNVEQGELSGDLQFNGHLSWANLHKNYWQHGRPLSTGTLNGASTTFLSSKRIREQQEIEFPLCCTSFDTGKFIATELGNGEVDKASFDLSKKTLKVTLKHD